MNKLIVYGVMNFRLFVLFLALPVSGFGQSNSTQDSPEIIKVTTQNYGSLVVAKKPTIILFAKTEKPEGEDLQVFEKLGEEFQSKVNFGCVNLESSPTLADLFQIKTTPHFMLFYKGEKVIERTNSNSNTLMDLNEGIKNCTDPVRLNYRKENEQYYSQFKLLPGVKETPSGVLYRVIKPGTGREVEKFARLEFTGKLTNGLIMDRSKILKNVHDDENDKNTTFNIEHLSPDGLREVMGFVDVESRIQVVIPHQKGMGPFTANAPKRGMLEEGDADLVPAYSTLTYDVTIWASSSLEDLMLFWIHPHDLPSSNPLMLK